MTVVGQVLFIQGGGPGAPDEWDDRLVDSPTRLLGVHRVVPMHYGIAPGSEDVPEQFRAALDRAAWTMSRSLPRSPETSQPGTPRDRRSAEGISTPRRRQVPIYEAVSINSIDHGPVRGWRWSPGAQEKAMAKPRPSDHDAREAPSGFWKPFEPGRVRWSTSPVGADGLHLTATKDFTQTGRHVFRLERPTHEIKAPVRVDRMVARRASANCSATDDTNR